MGILGRFERSTSCERNIRNLTDCSAAENVSISPLCCCLCYGFLRAAERRGRTHRAHRSASLRALAGASPPLCTSAFQFLAHERCHCRSFAEEKRPLPVQRHTRPLCAARCGVFDVVLLLRSLVAVTPRSGSRTETAVARTGTTIHDSFT